MIPNGMSAGGMMGLCTVLQYATGGLVPAAYSYVVINALLILIAVILLGTEMRAEDFTPFASLPLPTVVLDTYFEGIPRE